MKTIYVMKKLQRSGVIKRFTTCTQNTDKRLFIFCALVVIPTEEHHPTSLLKLLDNIIGGAEKNEAVTDYAAVYDTSGHFDSVDFCNFKDGTALNDRGPEFVRKVWANEHPIVEQCMLTELIVGRWPFNSNNYTKWTTFMNKDRTNPRRFKIYK